MESRLKTTKQLLILIPIFTIFTLSSKGSINPPSSLSGNLGQDLTVNESSKPSSGEDYHMKEQATWKGNLYCPLKRASNDQSFLELEDFFKNDAIWRKNGVFNIFLSETSCHSRPPNRVWCSIESMAKQNPNAVVWYVMTSQVVDIGDGLVRDLLKKYPNLRLVTIDLGQLFTGTPLEPLYRSGAWHTDTEWPAVNLSEMLRMAIVWHAGGFYSDTDVMCISSLTHIKNAIGLEAFNRVNCAGFHFDPHHPVLEKFMAYQNANFNPLVWGMNGPQVVTEVLKNLCETDLLSQGLECGGAKILPAAALSPVPFTSSRVLFQRSKINDINKRFPDTYAIHLWNKVTHDSPIIKGSGTVYDLAAAAFCPITREFATKKSLVY